MEYMQNRKEWIHLLPRNFEILDLLLSNTILKKKRQFLSF